MTNDREDATLVRVDLDAKAVAHYARRAAAAGRTLEEQILYELKVDHGFTVPDPGDVEATQRGHMFQRMVRGRILQG